MLTKLLMHTVLAILIARSASFTTIKLRGSNGRTLKTVGFHPYDEDAVDLQTFPITAPYDRSREWHKFVFERRDDVAWNLGQIAVHHKYNYQVVIVGIDPGPVAADVEWLKRMGVAELPHKEDQPFYWCLVDTTDREAPMMAYIPQDSLRDTEAKRALDFTHPDVEVFFDRAKPTRLDRKKKKDQTSKSQSSVVFATGMGKEPASVFKVGARVEGLWDNRGLWYHGEVVKVVPCIGCSHNTLYDVEYEDKMKEANVTMAHIREPHNYKPGDVVEALFGNSQVWYRGQVTEVDSKAHKYSVHFDDGDKEPMMVSSKLRWWGSAERERRARGTDFLPDAMPHNGWKMKTSHNGAHSAAVAALKDLLKSGPVDFSILRV